MKDGRKIHLSSEGWDKIQQARFFATQRSAILEAAGTMAAAFRKGRKILLFGNGGSAADAQHIAAEFVGRFIPERPALPALSLASDPSVVTALGNDYGFEAVFSRQVEAHGRAGDVAIGISTSGNSPNVLRGLEAARAAGLITVGFTGKGGGRMPDLADTVFIVESDRTPRIQETHILLGHSLCEIVDRMLHPDAYGRA
jgi:D-sedoheptulose 7-phosphate isomerase